MPDYTANMKLLRTKHTYLHAWTIPTCNIQTHTIEYQPPASTNHHAPAPCLKSFELCHKRRDHLWQLALELFKGSLRQTGSSMTPFNLTGNQADQQLRRQYNAWKKTGKRTQHTHKPKTYIHAHIMGFWHLAASRCVLQPLKKAAERRAARRFG